MGFLNALGSVSRHGQWRFRRVFRASLPDGRLDMSDAGLIDFSAASLVRLTVVPRPPYRRVGWDGDFCGSEHWPEARPILSASTADGTLLVRNPGIIEALFPDGWSRSVPPGLYDVRLLVTIGPETAEILNQPVEIR